jgi:dipeptidyl aminopeptidase/acylaminoacyl peptidase
MDKYSGPPLASPAEQQAAFSPDGRWMAYRSDESDRWEIYIQPFPGTGQKWQVSTSGGVEPTWRSDGKELYFVSGDSIMSADVRPSGTSLAIGTPHALFQTKLPRMERNRFVVSPDGRKFLVVVSADQEPNSITVMLNWRSILNTR